MRVLTTVGCNKNILQGRMFMIEVKNVTLKYPSGKGVFDLDFKIKAGTVMGCLGPNGAGKTTTIRALMGFMKPDCGSSIINGMDSYAQAPEIKKILGYIPGEIAFPDGMDCMDFLNYICEMRQITDRTLLLNLIERFQLDTKGRIKKFSKGMKQKIGIIIAFMHNPDVLILDEPTSGLDPLMQNEFIELILEEKKKGKTIFMSSHIFEECERTCDDVLIIKDGRIVAQSDILSLKSSKRKAFIVQTPQINELKAFGFEMGKTSGHGTEIYVKGEDIDSFIKKLSTINVHGLDVKSQNLEEIFMGYYGTEAAQL